MPGNCIWRWDEETGAASVFRKPSGYANGNTRDRQGRLLTCEHGGRRVSRTEPDGRVITLVDSFEGKKLNSPNDIVCKSDGSIWFTDPSFGILGNYEGAKAEPELPTNVYRWDGKLHGGGRRHQPAERPRLLARRVDPLRRRVARGAAQDPGFRRQSKKPSPIVAC